MHDKSPVWPLRGRLVVAALYELDIDDGVHSAVKHEWLAGVRHLLQMQRLTGSCMPSLLTWPYMSLSFLSSHSVVFCPSQALM